jgi:hypothetical protein
MAKTRGFRREINGQPYDVYGFDDKFIVILQTLRE